MTATNHIATGVLIGVLVHNPWLAVPAALISHFICDALPHMDYPDVNLDSPKFYYYLALDLGIATALLLTIWLLQPANALLLVICGAAAASPDSMWLYYRVYKRYDFEDIVHWLPRLHHHVQQRAKVAFWPIELAWFTLMGSLIIGHLY